MLLPVTGTPAVRIYPCCRPKGRRAYPGHLAGTVGIKGKDAKAGSVTVFKIFGRSKIETKDSPKKVVFDYF